MRAVGFFGGTGAGTPALILVAWVLAGLLLMLIADRRSPRRQPQAPEPTAA